METYLVAALKAQRNPDLIIIARTGARNAIIITYGCETNYLVVPATMAMAKILCDVDRYRDGLKALRQLADQGLLQGASLCCAS